MYRVELGRRAKKVLDDLPRSFGDGIALAIAGLAVDPRKNAEKLAGYANLYRIRVGNYRVIHEINDHNRLVVVVRVAKRDEAYRGL